MSIGKQQFLESIFQLTHRVGPTTLVGMAKKKLQPILAEVVSEMTRLGMTKYKLAKLAKLPPATVTRIISGDRPDPQLSTVLKLVGAVGLRVEVVSDRK